MTHIHSHNSLYTVPPVPRCIYMRYDMYTHFHIACLICYSIFMTNQMKYIMFSPSHSLRLVLSGSVHKPEKWNVLCDPTGISSNSPWAYTVQVALWYTKYLFAEFVYGIDTFLIILIGSGVRFRANMTLMFHSSCVMFVVYYFSSENNE